MFTRCWGEVSVLIQSAMNVTRCAPFYQWLRLVEHGLNVRREYARKDDASSTTNQAVSVLGRTALTYSIVIVRTIEFMMKRVCVRFVSYVFTVR
jgi:hypothetical protein